MLEAWKNAGLTYRHRGHEVFYRDEGSGPALLAIHGFPSASWDWHLLWPDLVRRFRVIAPDMIGFGWSAKPKAYEYSIVDQATLHEGLLRQLGVTRAHVLAHDYGDTVAQELLARHLDGALGFAIESVCLLNGGLFPEAHRPRTIQKVLASPIGALVGRMTSRRMFAKGMTAIFGKATPPSDALIDELWTLLRHDDGHRVLHRIIGYMAERRRHRGRWVGALTRADVPLRVIDGLDDPVSGAHMVARYRELVRDPDVFELAGIGHYPQLEDPAGVLRGFLAFHETLTRRARA